MDKRFPQVAEQLLLIERELRVLGWWRESPPSMEALSSREPFCVDLLAFDQWLQWIFLPRMKDILEQNLPLPNASGIVEMAEMVYSGCPQETHTLQQLLAKFDRLITETH
ncbi:YqcC family protein [Pseudomonas sp. 10B1]|uniref:YqcC family protein n=1 Tax=unclassified Pseudomonas TaxID=196821 RepID=UPI002AB45C8A|nr:MULTISPECIES: YqcC family protein [unclassified Pseudomonas]MDY7563386.1 YqcC family protein [Pseudomonas sp. AB6]MEA9978253.1 YqcC family protein [Pseudomonas sp. RTS4]MEA9995147.1 YqcC family protein [Pseudomonas sp. AA4]MEB0086892.1 YqcC family protein [Pseudomonas sp. RTI1]MEB0127354.1 YqcC family protein [Pseudomonas sp. CCC1.2]